MIIFCNFKLLADIIVSLRKLSVPLQHLIVWDKRKARSWIAWKYPLRHSEYILFAGYGSLDFRTGKQKKGVRRTSFGGELKKADPNPNEVSFEMFQEIWNIQVVPSAKRIHPTQKPVELSERLAVITRNMDLQVVLDPFAGSGALLEGFDTGVETVLGFELETKYKRKKSN